MNTTSTFPEKIDELLFFQDIDLNTKNVFDNYQKILTQKQYDKSAQYIKESGVPYYGADLFNLLEDMVYQLQDYLINNSSGSHGQMFYYTDDDVNIPDGAFGL